MACGDEGSLQPCNHGSRPEGAMQVQAGIPSAARSSVLAKTARPVFLFAPLDCEHTAMVAVASHT